MQPVQLPVVESCFCIFLLLYRIGHIKVWNLTRTKPLFANRDREYTCSNKKNDRNKIKRPDTLPLRVDFHLISLILNVVTYNEIHLNNNEHSKY